MHVSGEVVEWAPPRRLAVTWLVEGMKDFGELPECIVSYEIEPSGEAVRVTMTEVPFMGRADATSSRAAEMGWPEILSRPQEPAGDRKAACVGNEGPPPEFLEAVKACQKPSQRGSLG